MLPVGGKICAKCRRELSITIPLPNPQPNKRKLVDMPPPEATSPKKQKAETRLSKKRKLVEMPAPQTAPSPKGQKVETRVSKKLENSDPNFSGDQTSEPENLDHDMGQTNPLPNKRKLVEMPPPQKASTSKRQKVETRLSENFENSDILPDSNFLGIQKSEPEKADHDMGQTRRTRTRTSYIQETNRFGSSSESPESSENVENDDSWKPESQEIQPERVEAINTLLKLNGQKKEFVHRMQKPFHQYSQQKKCEQMEVLSASVESVINTFSAVKSDQINLHGRKTW